MSVNNNQKEVKPFSVEYSKTQLKCRKCGMLIRNKELRIATKDRVSSTLNDLDFFLFKKDYGFQCFQRVPVFPKNLFYCHTNLFGFFYLPS